MPTGNPLEQLRRRMQSNATPTAFAALAEEHRRAGRLAEAVAVCREGLERYPAYVSARVTLGRALLDSGDAPAAVVELEHAVAQSPDNLAAARALETARAALGDAPWPSAAAPDAPADLPLKAPQQELPTISSSVITTALGAGPDGPQEFGLAPDWSLPDTLPPLPPVAPPPLPDEDEQIQSLYPHVESPAIDGAPAHSQGDEPAGVWPAQAVVIDEAETFSWPIESSTPAPSEVWAVEVPLEPGAQEASSVWGDLTIEVPADTPAADEPVAVSSDPGAAAVEIAPDPPREDTSSAFWTGPFGGEAVAEDAAPFAGWGESAPPTSGETDQSPWSDESPADNRAWNTPDGPSATWALGDLHEADGADATPFQGVLDDEAPRPEPFASFADSTESAGDDPAAAFSALSLPEMPLPELPAAPALAQDEALELLWSASDEDLGTSASTATAPGSGVAALGVELPELPPLPVDAAEPAGEAGAEPMPVDAAWSGSVRSALGEVFALAGHAEALEPPAHPSPEVREAMAEAAVEAAREDAALGEDGPPILASLEQMLAAVRARRAALSGQLDS
jgi:hypothetical protein